MINIREYIFRIAISLGVLFSFQPLNINFLNVRSYAATENQTPYLRNIYLSEGDNIRFKKDKYEYIVDVTDSTEDILIRPKLDDISNIVKINGTTLNPDEKYNYETQLKKGKNKFEIEVIDSESKESNKYIIYVYRGGETAVYLKNILIDDNNIGFSQEKKLYNIELDEDCKSILLEAVPLDKNYTISVGGTVLNSDNNLIKINFSQNIGKYTFNIDVTDNETERTTRYAIDIYMGIAVTPNVSDSINQVIKPNQWVIVNGRWRYNDSLGHPIKNNWFFDSKYKGYYHFNSRGNMQTGWSVIDNSTYYLGNDGKRRSGWINYEDDWYYLDANGVMKTGWNFIDDKWYYLNEDGSMYTGWLGYKGNWYYLSHDGAMTTGWILYNKKWFYLNEDGTMKNGWQYYNGDWYYLNSDGSMRTGQWVYDDSKWYYINYSGTMRIGWLYKDDKYYYFNEDGSMNKKSKVIDGYLYNFNNDGSVNFE